MNEVAAYANSLIYTAVWTGLFLFCRFALFRQRSSIYSNRVVSLVHAFVALYLTGTTITFSHPFREYGKPSRPQEVMGQAAAVS